MATTPTQKQFRHAYEMSVKAQGFFNSLSMAFNSMPSMYEISQLRSLGHNCLQLARMGREGLERMPPVNRVINDAQAISEGWKFNDEIAPGLPPNITKEQWLENIKARTFYQYAELENWVRIGMHQYLLSRAYAYNLIMRMRVDEMIDINRAVGHRKNRFLKRMFTCVFFMVSAGLLSHFLQIDWLTAFAGIPLYYGIRYGDEAIKDASRVRRAVSKLNDMNERSSRRSRKILQQASRVHVPGNALEIPVL